MECHAECRGAKVLTPYIATGTNQLVIFVVLTQYSVDCFWLVRYCDTDSGNFEKILA
jgi:hypothetical protein